MISTKDIPTGGGKTPKTLQPGNIDIKINSIYLETYPFGEDAYVLLIDCEGPDLGENFEGFWRNKGNEAEGRHAGQVGRVKVSQWAFQDKTLSNGVVINRDIEISKALKNLAVATDSVAWFEAQNNKHETIESLVQQMNEDAPFKDKYMSACLAGREYENKQGYINYDLFLPKYTKDGTPYEAVDANTGRVFKYNENDHIIRKKNKDVNSFEPTAATAESGKGEFGL